MAQSLLAFDTDRIKEYVFASGALRDIRGASSLLDRLNRAEMPRVVAGAASSARTIYAQGGGGLFLVDSADAEHARQAVERLYRQETRGASITGAVSQLGTGGESDVHRQMGLLGYRLRAAKDRPPPVAALVTHAFLRPCDVCGVEYSSLTSTRHDQQALVCAACKRKHDEDRTLRGEQIPAWLGRHDLKAGPTDPLWKRLIASLREAGYPLTAEHERPADFGAVGRNSSPSGYFALIYADGDGMGERLKSLRGIEEVREFAAAVDESVYEAAVTAIVRHLAPAGPAGALDFDILLLGGDDLVIVTKAQAALDVAITLVEQFSLLTARRLGTAVRMSAGVVIAHTAYPFSAMLHLAESALKFAKRRGAALSKAGAAPAHGLINPLVVSGSVHLDFASYYEQVLYGGASPHARPLNRTLRPYSPDQLRRLMQVARELSRAPRSKLQQLREACFLSYEASCLEALAALLRWPPGGGKVTIQEFLHELAAGGGDVHFPWYLAGGELHTPFVDLVEFDRFVPRQADMETADAI